MLPAGPGNSSSSRAYGCATPAANDPADDRAGYSASRRLCYGVSRKHRGCTKRAEKIELDIVSFSHLLVVQSVSPCWIHSSAALRPTVASKIKWDDHTE
jgi:hypothetical protein